MKIVKEIKNSPFIPLKKEYYLGKIKFGCPYFYPMNFVSTIIYIRKLKLKTQEELNEYLKRYPYLKNDKGLKFTNLPTVRRSKNWIIKLFNTSFYIEIGTPISFKLLELGWKDKYDSPRFEWSPAFYIYFFKWQFIITYTTKVKNEDLYWEMYLWWKNYCNKDLEKAKNTWSWVDGITHKNTWNNKFIK